MRIGLGCMRLPRGDAQDEAQARATIAAAVAAGITVFDTAHAYGPGANGLGDGERLLAAALRSCGAQRRARIVTKGGMTRAGDGWVPDGRAKAIRGDCEASLKALGGVPIDTWLLHAPDPRTPWATSVRAVARLAGEGLVPRVGLCNVNRRQLDEALELAPVSAVEVALSLLDHRALRGGVIQRCAELGIAVIAHSPLGGPRRSGGLAETRTGALAEVAAAHDMTPAEVALAWVLGLAPTVIAIPGARRPQTAQSAVRAARLSLGAGERARLGRAYGAARPGPAGAAVTAGSTETAHPGEGVVVVMGIPGAGKTRLAETYVARGFARRNRDERGGSLRDIAAELGEALSGGERRIVLDNTYLTRAARSYVIDAARPHAVPVECVWLDTPLAQAQVNLVVRLLDQFGALPGPDELRALARRGEGVLAPTSQMRTVRELEPPAGDEGFARIEIVPFVRRPPPDKARGGVFVAAAALRRGGWERVIAAADPAAPHLVFDWSPDGSPDLLDAEVTELAGAISGTVSSGLCPHGGGPPRCWCRPPLPGLVLAFAHHRGLQPEASTLVGTGPAHRTLAAALGAGYTSV